MLSDATIKVMKSGLRRERVNIQMSDLDESHEARELAKIDAALTELDSLAANPAALICDGCNDYLTPPSYCEACYGNVQQFLKEAMQGGDWEPVEDGSDYRVPHRKPTIGYVADDAETIGVWIVSLGDYVDVKLPPDLRLCRRTPAQPMDAPDWAGDSAQVDPTWDTADRLYAFYDAAYRMGSADAYNNEADYRRARADMFAERDKIVAWNNRPTIQLPAMPAPDWTQAPEWAMWWSVEPDGNINWHEEEPQVTFSYWSSRKYWSRIAGQFVTIPLGCDWRLLKEQRPQEGGAA